jgi:hypothetical protein
MHEFAGRQWLCLLYVCFNVSASGKARIKAKQAASYLVFAAESAMLPASAAAATGVKWQGSAFRQHSHTATSPRPSSGLQRWPSNSSNGAAAAAAAAAQPEQPLLQQHKAASSSSGACEGVPSVVDLSAYGGSSSSSKAAAGDAADSLAQLRVHHSGLMRLGLLMAVST